MSSKYCLVSDIHVGCHGNCENWHKIVLDWAEWLKEELKSKGIHNMIICGDFFDDRHEIGVNTLAVASEIMRKWQHFDIYMITGNHDLFYKTRNDVSSTSVFEGRKNLTFMDKLTTKEMHGKTASFVPWGEDITQCPKSDVIFGHFEINGFVMSVGKVAEGVLTPKALTSKSPLTFSGHFHLKDDRSYKNGNIVYIGSPYQQNWGERSNIPGYYILDMKTMDYEFFENDISPRHVKLKSDKITKKEIEGNIVSIDLDKDLGQEEIEKIKAKIYKSAPIEADFNVNREEYQNEEGVEYDGNVNIVEIMDKYVDGLKVEDYASAVKDKLKELHLKYSK